METEVEYFVFRRARKWRNRLIWPSFEVSNRSLVIWLKRDPKAVYRERSRDLKVQLLRDPSLSRVG